MTAPREPSRRRWRALGALAFASLFIVGPTPGDIGGCGGELSSNPVPGNATEAEYDYFDQGMCAHLCFQLRECGLICDAIRRRGAPCDNDSEDAYRQCVRGELRDEIFGASACPHTCGPYQGVFLGASMQDVYACGHAITALSCTSLSDVIRRPPAACTAICQ
ncbi:MAG: hypothetical protein R3A52_09305 [Polyangiales bacterium]